MTIYQKYKLIIAAGFLALLSVMTYIHSISGTFVVINENKILDTKAGRIYNLHNSEYLELDDFNDENDFVEFKSIK